MDLPAIRISQIASQFVGYLQDTDIVSAGVDSSIVTTKRLLFSTLKSHFINKYVPDTVEVDTLWADDKKVKFGNSGDLTIYHSEPTSYIESTKQGGNLIVRLKAGSGSNLDMMTFLPTPNKIQIGEAALSNNGIGGIKFGQNGNLKLQENIDMASFFISDDGDDNTGLNFSEGNGTFYQNLTVIGTLYGANTEFTGYLEVTGDLTVDGEFTPNGRIEMESPLDMNNQYIVKGSVQCMGVESNGQAFFVNGVRVSGGDLSVTTNISCLGDINGDKLILTRTGKMAYLIITDGVSTPTPVSGSVLLYIEGGDLKLRYPNGDTFIVFNKP
jgi:cytoskeletal protein CcmA (bactofilin family)